MSFKPMSNKPGQPNISDAIGGATSPFNGDAAATPDIAAGVAGAAAQTASSLASEATNRLIEGVDSAFAPSPLVKAAVRAAAQAAAQSATQAASSALEGGGLPDGAQDIMDALGGAGSPSRTVNVSGSAIPAGMLSFVSVSGDENIGELFSYIVELKAPDSLNMGYFSPAANLPLKDMVGKDINIDIELDNGDTRHINGLVTAARVCGLKGRSVTYEVRVEPWLELATRTSDYKIFQNKTVVDIIDEVLGDYPFPMEKRLTNETYPKRAFQVQYGETDYAFIVRLMQEFGIYYYFEHSEGSHKLILIDAIGSHTAYPGGEIASYHQEGIKIDQEYISNISAQESLRTGKWVLNDFDFQNPRAKLTSEQAMPRETGHANYEHYEWPGDYFDPKEGELLARIRMEAQRSLGSRVHGGGNVRTLATGYTFTLENCPSIDINQEYLLISTRLVIQDIGAHSGERQSFNYQVFFELQPTKEIYRPQRTIPKPQTRGPQSAIVVGPKGEEIWTDKYGRIKVKFPWDRDVNKDENSSCWIRVSQPWAGKGFGGMQIPRIGQEVIVDFKNGDPDLPIVTGRVYNADTMPPWSLPANKTQSGMFSRSMKGGPSNGNALRFEDKQGAEEVKFHAEKDLNTTVNNNETHSVNANRTKTISLQETATVGAGRNHSVKLDDNLNIGQNNTIQVAGTYTLIAGDSIQLSCGKSTLVLTSDGMVAITCEEFNITAQQSGAINTVGGQLDLNMSPRNAVAPLTAMKKKELTEVITTIFGK